MLELLRNCAHGSDIAVYKVDTPNALWIRKCSYTEAGFRDLCREAQGWKWYQNKSRSLPADVVFLETSGFCRLDVPYVKGHKVHLNRGLEENADVLCMAIREYTHLWKDELGSCVPLHGDLSLDNILITSSGVFFVDWEHFHTDAGPWGFDAVYLIFESLWFSTSGRRPRKHELAIIRELLDQLCLSGRLDIQLRNRPLGTIRDFIHARSELWGEQLKRNPGKLPILYYDPSLVSFIDQSFGFHTTVRS